MKPGPRSILALILSAVGLTYVVPARAADNGWSFKIGGFNAVKGSGVVKSETRAVTSFQAITLRGSMNIVLRQAAHEGLQLTGDDNVLPLIEAVVVSRNGVPTLELGMKSGSTVMSDNPVTATIDVTTLSALLISGSGEVRGDGLKAQALVLTISGSGEVKLRQLNVADLSVRVSGSGAIEFAGRAAKLGVDISGSGAFDSSALDADDVSITIAGSGDAKVDARKTLNVSIAGNGEVAYSGDPVVKSHIAGHGEVKKR